MCIRDRYTLIECSHLGYMDRGVFVERRILAIGTGIYLVMDTCYGASSENVHGAAQDLSLIHILYYFITSLFEEQEESAFPYAVDIIGQLNRCLLYTSRCV